MIFDGELCSVSHVAKSAALAGSELPYHASDSMIMISAAWGPEGIGRAWGHWQLPATRILSSNCFKLARRAGAAGGPGLATVQSSGFILLHTPCLLRALARAGPRPGGPAAATVPSRTLIIMIGESH